MGRTAKNLARSLHTLPAMATLMERSRRVVLLVGHEPEMMAVAGEALRRGDYEVVTARSAVEAQERMDAATPDLLLMDSELPEMDNFLKRQRFVKDRLAPPVVFLTSPNSAEDLRRGYEYGALCHIFKGDGVLRLPDMLDQAFERLEFEGDLD